MIEMSIKKLVQYGRTTGLIEAEDEIYARNQILEVLKMSEYEEPGEIHRRDQPGRYLKRAHRLRCRAGDP